MVTVRSLCVFCGSSPGEDGHGELARDVGQLVAETGIRLVYGGAWVGLMGVLADACLAAGGEVTGVMPRGLFTREVGHTGLTELHEVDSMHERKQRLYDLADAFVALPGGFGTLEELAEVATWSQLGLLRKPIVLLDTDGFWDPLVALLDRMVTSGLLTPVNRALVQRARSPRAALDIARAVPPEPAEKWITPEQR